MKRRDFLKESSAAVIGTSMIPLFGISRDSSKPVFRPADTTDHAKYIWYDTSGQGRNLYGNFRKSFSIDGDISSANLNLFADTSYQLFINGKYIQYGPVRFDPRFPLYDVHDISKHLKKGKNTIAIQVNYFGVKTYKSIINNAGLITWGEIKSGNSVIDLASNEGSWRAAPSRAHSMYASKMSFALNPKELYEECKEEKRWKGIDFDDSHWSPSKEINNQEAWGELEPRSIPFMSGKDVEIKSVKAVVPLVQKEDWFSFSIPLPHFFEDNKDDYSHFIAFSMWIYSPVDQSITAGVFFGEHWLNGKEIPRGYDSENRSLRRNERWELKAGWNYFFGKVGAYYDVLDQYIALPKEKGLVVSAGRTLDPLHSFKRSPLLKQELYDKTLKEKPLPYSSDDQLEEVGGWILIRNEEKAQSPCRETSWDEYGDPIEHSTPENLNGSTFKKSNYPEGFSIILELDHVQLFFPEIRMKGVAGATIDLTYAEFLNQDQLHFRHSFNFEGGDRILCSGDSLDWFPGHPRGMLFLKITVRNAPGDVTLKSIQLRSVSYPVEYKGRFTCSDPLLNEVWKMGERSVAANMTDAYVDCTSRERGMYIRDVIIQYHINLATFGDQALMHRCVELFGQSPEESGKFRVIHPNTGDYSIADFSLNMVEGYWNYYEYSGDIKRIRADWDAIVHNMKWFVELSAEHADGLLNGEWHLKRNDDQMYGGFHGDLVVPDELFDRNGFQCVLTCTYLLALQATARLAEALGEEKEAGRYEAMAQKLGRSVVKNFWDPEKKCFSDNLERTTHSVHANLFVIRAGIANSFQTGAVKKHVIKEFPSLFINGYDASDGSRCSAPFSYYIFEGLYKLGLYQIAENTMRQGWGWALAQGIRTTPEYFNLTSSLCQAWSGSPTWYLSKNILGVRFPKAPDLSKVEIEVKTEDIQFAEGAFPHPDGVIEVRWHMEGQERVFDYVKAPDGVIVKIIG